MKPIIAITPSIEPDEQMLKLNRTYIKSVELAGGVPIILNTSKDTFDILDIADGIILSGGVDVDPTYFGELPIEKLGEISPIRDNFEIKLCQYAYERDIPMLGICRGIQVMSIALGGTIFQDISEETKIKHSQNAPKYYGTHPVKITDSTILSGIFKTDNIIVNSFHHQAVKELPNDFIVSAHCSDGIIEAIEHKTKKFIVGVQWHPECMTETSDLQLNLFKAFTRISHQKKTIDFN